MTIKKIKLIFILFSLINYKLFSQPLESFEISLEYNIDSVKFRESTWRKFNRIVANKSIFFIGESHNVLSNTKEHFTIFTYLYYYAGVRCYVMEGNYSFVYFINKYIQTGEQKFLDKVFLNHSSQDSMVTMLNAEFLNFYEKLYKFNTSKPTDERIKVIGIDSEPFYYTSKMIKEIIKNRGEIPKEIRPTILSLIDFKLKKRYAYLPTFEKKKVKPLLKKALENFEAYEHIYQQFFNEDLIHIKMIIKNVATLKRSENALLENFTLITDYLQNNKFYFQYGNLHSRLKSRWLADQVNKSSSFKGKVLSIGTQYNGCDFWWGKPYLNQTFGAISSYKKNLGKMYFDKLTTVSYSKYNLVKLDDILKKKTGYDYIFDINGKHNRP